MAPLQTTEGKMITQFLLVFTLPLLIGGFGGRRRLNIRLFKHLGAKTLQISDGDKPVFQDSSVLNKNYCCYRQGSLYVWVLTMTSIIVGKHRTDASGQPRTDWWEKERLSAWSHLREQYQVGWSVEKEDGPTTPRYTDKHPHHRLDKHHRQRPHLVQNIKIKFI